MSQVQTDGISLILIQILRYFTDTQTGIQTATTSSFRQTYPIFLFLKRVQSCPHVVFWRHLTEVITRAVRTQMSLACINTPWVEQHKAYCRDFGTSLPYQITIQWAWKLVCQCRATHSTTKQKGVSQMSFID